MATLPALRKLLEPESISLPGVFATRQLLCTFTSFGGRLAGGATPLALFLQDNPKEGGDPGSQGPALAQGQPPALAFLSPVKSGPRAS